jgi:nucleoside-triphosphatase THEP1
MPPRIWSDEQAEMLKVVREGVVVEDANVDKHKRTLLVTGKPGAGKTEAVCACAVEAAEKGERVLIACPIGALVDTYRQKLPPNENIVVETVHSSHRITRRADEQYVPPGRLRTFDLIIYDEVSQLEASVWNMVKVAIEELNPHPFVCLVGDFKQLQPAFGEAELKETMRQMVIDGTIKHIDLQQHPHARSTDPALLEFLSKVRDEQPERNEIGTFFDDRHLAPGSSCRDDAAVFDAVQKSVEIEQEAGKHFVFLTVTNPSALKINHTRCMLEFGDHPDVKDATRWRQSDPDLGGLVVAVKGMRIRLTRNVDKERSFVNGTLATVEYVLSPEVFVAVTTTGIRILVHPVKYDGEHFMPYSYGYATTMRKAQGSTMDLVCLWFDHKYAPDRGYAYVGASRVRRAIDLYLMGKIRRSDWLPVGMDARGGEQERRGSDSDSTFRDSDEASEDQGGSDSDTGMGSEDQGASSDKSSSVEDQGATCDDESSVEDQGASSQPKVDGGSEEDQGATDEDEPAMSEGSHEDAQNAEESAGEDDDTPSIEALFDDGEAAVADGGGEATPDAAVSASEEDVPTGIQTPEEEPMRVHPLFEGTRSSTTQLTLNDWLLYLGQ